MYIYFLRKSGMTLFNDHQDFLTVMIKTHAFRKDHATKNLRKVGLSHH